MFFKKRPAFDPDALIAEIEAVAEKLKTAEGAFASRAAAGNDTADSGLAAEYLKRSRAAMSDCCSSLSITLAPKDGRKLKIYIAEQKRILSDMAKALHDLTLYSSVAEEKIYPLALELCEKQKELATV